MHEPASRTSPVISALIEGGSTCVGITVIDDIACSINDENEQFGMPKNAAVPDRIPGGCLSGSVVAIASDLVDFSLGVDTIGSVRVPGAYCGILGFQPSYAAVSNVGVTPLSLSLDTIGWFAKDPSVLCRVGHLLLQLPYADTSPPRHMIIADDCFQLLKISVNRVKQVVIKSTEKLFGNFDFRHEFKDIHEEWINSVKPVVVPCVSSHMNVLLDSTHINHCQSARNEAHMALNTFLKDDGILVLPTVSGPPPKLNAKEVLSEDYQTRALSLLAIASMSGCCQVTVPLGVHEMCPVSVSFIARHGGDRFLLDTVQTMNVTL